MLSSRAPGAWRVSRCRSWCGACWTYVPALTQYAHVQVYVVPTRSAQRFFSVDDVQALDPTGRAWTTADLAQTNAAARAGAAPLPPPAARGPRVRVWHEDDEWGAWTRVGDPVLHIEVRSACA